MKLFGEVPKREGFKVSEFLTDLNVVITLQFSPDGRLFMLEKNSGLVRVVKDGKLIDKPWAKMFVDPVGERGLLGIAFDPNFKDNSYVYFYYSVPGSLNNRVVRLKEKDGMGAKIGVGETLVLEIPDHIKATNHNGGNIAFGPDGMLYITTGDGGGKPGRSHDDTNLLGKMLRVDVAGALPVKYKKPSDIIFAKGLRNSFDLAFNPLSNKLYATENGPIGYDEINLVEEGGNYGWPYEKGRSLRNKFTNPLWDFGIRSVSPTGIVFYPSGKEVGNFPGEYQGKMFVVDYNFGRVYMIELKDKLKDRIAKKDFHTWYKNLSDDGSAKLSDIIVGPDGSLFAAAFSKVYKIEFVGYKRGDKLLIGR